MNPREQDNIGVMHCGHQRYQLGDKGVPTPFVDDNWRAGIERPEIFVTLPIYMYDHSGLTISHSPFSCPWDSGLLGWHYVTKDAVKKNWPKLRGKKLLAAVEACLDAELKAYDAYLRGDTDDDEDE